MTNKCIRLAHVFDILFIWWCSRITWHKNVKYISVSTVSNPGVGWLKPPFYYFSDFQRLSHHWLLIEYHIHIWQASSQLIYGVARQIWKWFNELNWYFFYKIKYFLGGINGRRSDSNPRPWSQNKILKKCKMSLFLEPVSLSFWLRGISFGKLLRYIKSVIRVFVNCWHVE